jgi:hypothetical protein
MTNRRASRRADCLDLPVSLVSRWLRLKAPHAQPFGINDVGLAAPATHLVTGTDDLDER